MQVQVIVTTTRQVVVSRHKATKGQFSHFLFYDIPTYVFGLDILCLCFATHILLWNVIFVYSLCIFPILYNNFSKFAIRFRNEWYLSSECMLL